MLPYRIALIAALLCLSIGSTVGEEVEASALEDEEEIVAEVVEQG